MGRESEIMIMCSVCGFPITNMGCLHTVLGFASDQWRGMSLDERKQALSAAKHRAKPVRRTIARKSKTTKRANGLR